MKLKLKRRDCEPLYGHKKVINIGVSRDLTKFDEHSDDIDYPDDNFWSITYRDDVLGDMGLFLEFKFELNRGKRTLIPIYGIVWEEEGDGNAFIDDDFYFDVDQ